MLTRDDAVALDEADPLRRWRDEFVIPDPAWSTSTATRLG